MKGQRSRAGAKIRPEIRDMIKKIPKLRGYKFNKRTKKRGAKIEKPKKGTTKRKIASKKSGIKTKIKKELNKEVKKGAKDKK